MNKSLISILRADPMFPKSVSPFVVIYYESIREYALITHLLDSLNFNVHVIV